MTNTERHGMLCAQLHGLWMDKNADYGDSFHQTWLEDGAAMARVRLTDKLVRFKTLTQNGWQSVNDESVRDTLMDLANYALMTAMELDIEAEERNEKNERNFPMDENNSVRKPRQDKAHFDKTEHDFLMDAKRRGKTVTIYLGGNEYGGNFKGKILEFGPRTIKLEGYHSKILVYKSAISGISDVSDA